MPQKISLFFAAFGRRNLSFACKCVMFAFLAEELYFGDSCLSALKYKPDYNFI